MVNKQDIELISMKDKTQTKKKTEELTIWFLLNAAEEINNHLCRRTRQKHVKTTKPSLLVNHIL